MNYTSLKHGKQFANHRQKREGFQTTLDTSYNQALQNYGSIQHKLNANVSNNLSRVTNNAYVNKIIQFPSGQRYYVTNEGVAKYIASDDILNSLSNISKDIVKVPIDWNSSYNIVGTQILLNPPLLVGKPVVKNESLGNEGYNVFASSMATNSSDTYLGCFTANDTNANAFISFEACKQNAMDNGYPYFGFQNVREDGLGQCLLKTASEQSNMRPYDKNVSAVAIWSSGTSGSGATKCYVSTTGQLILTDMSGKALWTSNNPPEDCINGGTIITDTLVATYGGNCNNAVQGNSTAKVLQVLKDANYPQQLSMPINNSLLSDTVSNCTAKNWDTAYQCGNAWKSSHIENAEGQNFIYDCSEQASKCVFFLVLQPDGNLCIYRGVDPDSVSKTGVWCAMTNGKQISENPEWMATNSKFGRSYMKVNESLNSGEWIGSDNGALKLTLELDGNLVLYTPKQTPGCKAFNTAATTATATAATTATNATNATAKMAGTNDNAIAMYQLDKVGNRDLLGKFGYINADSLLSEYPDTMIGFVNDYQIYQNTNNDSEAIATMVASSQDECQNACNANAECAGYAYQASSQTCWLKKSYKSPRQPANGVNLGLRRPQLQPESPLKTVDIDTVQFANYLPNLNTTSQFSPQIVSQTDLAEYEAAKQQLFEIGEQLVGDTQQLNARQAAISKQLKANEQRYNAIQQKKSSYSSLKEGMTNTNTNTNQMVIDSSLRVDASSYRYVMWSVLAIGAIALTIKLMKK